MRFDYLAFGLPQNPLIFISPQASHQLNPALTKLRRLIVVVQTEHDFVQMTVHIITCLDDDDDDDDDDVL